MKLFMKVTTGSIYTKYVWDQYSRWEEKWEWPVIFKVFRYVFLSFISLPVAWFSFIVTLLIYLSLIKCLFFQKETLFFIQTV